MYAAVKNITSQCVQGQCDHIFHQHLHAELTPVPLSDGVGESSSRRNCWLTATYTVTNVSINPVLFMQLLFIWIFIYMDVIFVMSFSNFSDTALPYLPLPDLWF